MFIKNVIMERTILIISFILTSFICRGQDFDTIKNLDKFTGFFDFYYVKGTDKIYLSVETPGKDY